MIYPKCPNCKKEYTQSTKNAKSVRCYSCMHVFAPSTSIELSSDTETKDANKIILTKSEKSFLLQDKELKCEILFPEWFLIMREIKTLKSFTFIDAENKTVAMFKPYIVKNSFDVAIELAPINIGKRFEEMSSLN